MSSFFQQIYLDSRPPAGPAGEPGSLPAHAAGPSPLPREACEQPLSALPRPEGLPEALPLADTLDPPGPFPGPRHEPAPRPVENRRSEPEAPTHFPAASPPVAKPEIPRARKGETDTPPPDPPPPRDDDCLTADPQAPVRQLDTLHPTEPSKGTPKHPAPPSSRNAESEAPPATPREPSDPRSASAIFSEPSLAPNPDAANQPERTAPAPEPGSRADRDQDRQANGPFSAPVRAREAMPPAVPGPGALTIAAPSSVPSRQDSQMPAPPVPAPPPLPAQPSIQIGQIDIFIQAPSQGGIPRDRQPARDAAWFLRTL